MIHMQLHSKHLVHTCRDSKCLRLAFANSSKRKEERLLEQLQNTFEFAMSIHDADGSVLFAKGNPSLEHKHPISIEDNIIGWVCGENHAEPIVTLLNFLAQQELEKKHLGYEVLEGYRK